MTRFDHLSEEFIAWSAAKLLYPRLSRVYSLILPLTSIKCASPDSCSRGCGAAAFVESRRILAKVSW